MIHSLPEQSFHVNGEGSARALSVQKTLVHLSREESGMRHSRKCAALNGAHRVNRTRKARCPHAKPCRQFPVAQQLEDVRNKLPNHTLKAVVPQQRYRTSWWNGLKGGVSWSLRMNTLSIAGRSLLYEGSKPQMRRTRIASPVVAYLVNTRPPGSHGYQNSACLLPPLDHSACARGEVGGDPIEGGRRRRRRSGPGRNILANAKDSTL